jgi:hypothetical protein
MESKIIKGIMILVVSLMAVILIASYIRDYPLIKGNIMTVQALMNTDSTYIDMNGNKGNINKTGISCGDRIYVTYNTQGTETKSDDIVIAINKAERR